MNQTHLSSISRKFDGKVITEDGIYDGIPIEDYHRNPFLCDAPSISSTGLKLVAQRPSMYWEHSVYNINRLDKGPEPRHFIFGRAAHHLLLGEEGFAQTFAVRPEHYPNDKSKKWNSNSKDCKEWLENMAEQGRSVVTSAELEKIKRIADKLSQNKLVQGGIMNGPIEQSVLVKFSSWWLRSRPDVLPMHGDYVDLKTSARIEYDQLAKNIGTLGYYIQSGITKICADIIGMPFENYVYMFVETEPPFDIVTHHSNDQNISLGVEMAEECIFYLEECVNRWEFPSFDGFAEGITDISMPPWLSTQIENQIQYIRQERKFYARPDF